MKIRSIGEMIQELMALQLTNPGRLNDWEHNFIDSIASKTGSGKITTALSEKQVEKIAETWEKKIAGSYDPSTNPHIGLPRR